MFEVMNKYFDVDVMVNFVLFRFVYDVILEVL